MRTKTITLEDLKAAVRYCEYHNGSFSLEDIWDNLKKAKLPKERKTEEFFNIGKYRITRFPRIGYMKHITISRRDGKPIHNWKDIQRIKNKVCGPDVEACELYPAERRLVDQQNTYHLWVLPPGMSFPFGFKSCGRYIEMKTKDKLKLVGKKNG
jgi:hypothetical protein